MVLVGMGVKKLPLPALHPPPKQRGDTTQQKAAPSSSVSYATSIFGWLVPHQARGHRHAREKPLLAPGGVTPVLPGRGRKPLPLQWISKLCFILVGDGVEVGGLLFTVSSKYLCVFGREAETEGWEWADPRQAKGPGRRSVQCLSQQAPPPSHLLCTRPCLPRDVESTYRAAQLTIGFPSSSPAVWQGQDVFFSLILPTPGFFPAWGTCVCILAFMRCRHPNIIDYGRAPWLHFPTCRLASPCCSDSQSRSRRETRALRGGERAPGAGPPARPHLQFLSQVPLPLKPRA